MTTQKKLSAKLAAFLAKPGVKEKAKEVKIELLEAENKKLESQLYAIHNFVNELVVEYHKDCLKNIYTNGKFWSAKEIQGFIQSIRS